VFVAREFWSLQSVASLNLVWCVMEARLLALSRNAIFLQQAVLAIRANLHYWPQDLLEDIAEHVCAIEEHQAYLEDRVKDLRFMQRSSLGKDHGKRKGTCENLHESTGLGGQGLHNGGKGLHKSGKGLHEGDKGGKGTCENLHKGIHKGRAHQREAQLGPFQKGVCKGGRVRDLPFARPPGDWRFSVVLPSARPPESSSVDFKGAYGKGPFLCILRVVILGIRSFS